MTLKEAEKTLRNHQLWRKGIHLEPNYKHEDLTPAIETVLEYISSPDYLEFKKLEVGDIVKIKDVYKKSNLINLELEVSSVASDNTFRVWSVDKKGTLGCFRMRDFNKIR